MFLSIFDGMTDDRRSHIFTIKDSPRLPRELWDQFRQVAEARGEHTIDALRRALELYIQQERTP